MRALGLGLLLILPAMTAAEAGVCPAARQAPAVTVTALLPPPPETHTASYRELTSKLNRALRPDSDALGLSSSLLGENPRSSFRMVPHGGQDCYYLAALEVQFGYVERLVQVAREVPEESCLYREILGHERKHVAVDDAVVRDSLPYVEAEVRRFAAGFGPVQAPDRETVDQLLDAALEKAMRPILDHVSALENAAQDKVDTPAEYARVENACRIQAGPTETAAAGTTRAPLAPGAQPRNGGK